MKKWLNILLTASLVISLTACGQPIDNGESSSDAETSSAVVSEANESSEAQSEAQEEQTVEITVPKTMVTDDTPSSLTEEQKKMGYTQLKKNEDGSLTYVVEKDRYQEMLEKSKQEAKNQLDAMKKDPNYTTIQSVTYNDDLTQVTLIVSGQMDFEQSMGDTFAILNAGLTASTYQALAGNASQKVTVSVKDQQTGTVFTSMVYPDAFNS